MLTRVKQSLLRVGPALAVRLSSARARCGTSRLLSQSSSTVYAHRADVGVAKALSTPPGDQPVFPTLFKSEFSIADRVALVTGANGGLGLEMVLALVESGARAVYCIDLPEKPGEAFSQVRNYVSRMQGTGGEGRMEYVSADVTDQDKMWKLGETIGDREGRMDVCVTAAGIPGEPGSGGTLKFPAQGFQQLMNVNLNGSLYTAQAAGQQMERFGNGGSIIFISSLIGHQAVPALQVTAYGSSKSAILQLTRTMACELGPKKIRANSVSPGYIGAGMLKPFAEQQPEVVKFWGSQSPMGRVGGPDELRGVMAFLASDASSFCTGSE